MFEEPLPLPEAEKRIKTIARDGTVHFADPHAMQAMADDNLATVDVMNVLRAGYVDDVEFARGSWRYRMRTQRICAPTRFLSEDAIEVVTVWRVKRQ
jgi:hypothetical protein